MSRKSELTTLQINDLAHYFLGPEWWCFKTIGHSIPMGAGEYCLRVHSGTLQRTFYAPTLRAVFRAAGVKLPVRPQFDVQGDRVMQGEKWIANACSRTFATRIVNALNEYEPDRRGL